MSQIAGTGCCHPVYGPFCHVADQLVLHCCCERLEPLGELLQLRATLVGASAALTTVDNDDRFLLFSRFVAHDGIEALLLC